MSEQILQSILDATLSLNDKIDGLNEKIIRLSTQTEHNTDSIETLHKIVWRGNGQPSMQHRIDLFSDQIESSKLRILTVEARVDREIKDLGDKIDKKNSLIASLIIGLLLCIAGWGLTTASDTK